VRTVLAPVALGLALGWTLLPTAAQAKDRSVTFCLEDGEGGSARRGHVLVWSDELEIARDAENAFKIDDTGCVEVESLRWNDVDFPLKAWMSLNYEVQAPGYYQVPGTHRIKKKKKRNTKVIMLERKQG